MWLPKSVYEWAPHYWFGLGLLLIVVGTYLGFQTDPRFAYLGAGIGLACCAWSFRVFATRKKQRAIPYHDADLDQTCELNYDPKQF